MVWLKTVLFEQRKRYLRVKRDGNFQSKKIYAMIHLIETIRPLFQNQRSVMKEIYVFRTRAKEVVFTVNMKKNVWQQYLVIVVLKQNKDKFCYTFRSIIPLWKN